MRFYAALGADDRVFMSLYCKLPVIDLSLPSSWATRIGQFFALEARAAARGPDGPSAAKKILADTPRILAIEVRNAIAKPTAKRVLKTNSLPRD
jgi:hypothetical protein